MSCFGRGLRRCRLSTVSLGVWSGLVFAFLYLPILLLVVFSFNSSRLNIRWEGFSTKWYESLVSNKVLLAAFQNSLVIASATTVLSTVLGTLGAWMLYRYRFPMQRTLALLIFIPMVMPEVLMGVSLLVLFVQVLHIPLGYTTITIAHTTFCFPFVLVAVQARLHGLDPFLEEAAMDLGATPFQAFWKVIVPFLMPAIVSGALMAFTLSLDEYIVSVFTTGPQSQTLPLKVYGMAKVGLNPQLNALSALFIVGTFSFALGSYFFGRKKPMKKNQTLAMSALVALLLIGCGKAPQSSNLGAPGEESKDLNIYCWSEYIPQPVIDQFSKETGIHVSVENYASNEEMLAKLGAGGGSYDIIQPSEYVTQALVQENLLAPIDKSKIPNLKHIAPQFLNRAFDPGNQFTVPYMAGTVGIVVNTAMVTGDIKGFGDVFKPENNQKIVVVDDAREFVTWVLISQGIPLNDVGDANLEKAKPILEKWLPLVKVYDSDSPKTALLNGDVTIGVVWGGEAAILLNEDKKFQWVIPCEGTHLFIDSLAIPKGSKNTANAEAFMNFILRPEISKQISDAFPYTNPNLAARQLLTPEQLANPASYPPDEEIAKMDTFRDIGQQASKIDELVTSLKVQ